MVDSSSSNQERSVYDDMWQISWGEKDSIEALRQRKTPLKNLKSLQQGTWRQFQPHTPPQAGGSAVNCQLQGFPVVGFMMPQALGAQCDYPTIVFVPQSEPLAPSKPPGTFQTQARLPHERKTICGASTKSGAHSQNQSLDDDVCLTTSGDRTKGSCVQNMTPDDFEGELPSVGSVGHFEGECKRCAFYPKGRCRNGKDCAHCHFSHEPRSRLRKRCTTASDKCANPEGSITSESMMLDAAMAQDGGLFEVLAYLTEPRPANNKREQQAVASKEVDSSVGEDIVATLNNALQEVAKVFANDMADSSQECKVGETKLSSKDFDGDAVDADTIPSVSGLSDDEDTTNTSFTDSDKGSLSGTTDMSKKCSVSDVSDSESASLQDFASMLGHADQEYTSRSNGLASLSTPWKARERIDKEGSLGHCTTADIARMTRALLNKLTEEKFESLCHQVLSLNLSTPEQLSVLVAEIFQKATTQDGFRKLYSELCMRLDAHLTAKTSNIGGKAFRKALVDECQATFEGNLQPVDTTLFVGLSGDEIFEAEQKLKTQRLGNMRFIGDLFVRRLLAPKLLPAIVYQLLEGGEDSLESLIALIAVVASEFDKKASLYQAPLRDAFAVFQRKLNAKSMSPRLCCLIQDLLDTKARGWALR